MALIMNNYNNQFVNQQNWENMLDNFQINNPNQPNWYFIILNEFLNNMHNNLVVIQKNQITNDLFANWINDYQNDLDHFVDLELYYNFLDDDINHEVLNDYNRVMEIYNFLFNNNRNNLNNVVNNLINYNLEMNNQNQNINFNIQNPFVNDNILNINNLNNNNNNNNNDNNLNNIDNNINDNNIDNLNNNNYNVNDDNQHHIINLENELDFNQIMNEPILNIAGNILTNDINNDLNEVDIDPNMFQDDNLDLEQQPQQPEQPQQQIVLNIQHAVREDICSVCISTINIGDECIVTNCDHMFHSNCINPWLHNHHTCPNCRANL